MEVPAPCPHCGTQFVWEVDLAIPAEIAWAAPQAPRFRYQCASCQKLVVVTFAWSLEAGAAARPLRLAGGGSGQPPAPRILLCDHCPHGCGLHLGLRLEPDDPWATARVEPGVETVLGGYRCPRCDGEGRLRIAVMVEAATDD